MAQHWTSRAAQKWVGIFRSTPRLLDRSENDADARRMRTDLDAIRARFPDHA